MRLISLTAIALAFPPALSAQDGSLLDRVRAALELPVLGNEARESGVPEERVSTTIRDIFRSGVPAADGSRILDQEVRAVREGGPTDNFGSYVRTQVDAGLRGRALAEAIHREHARRGMGKPNDEQRPANASTPRARGQGRVEAPRQDSVGRGRRP